MRYLLALLALLTAACGPSTQHISALSTLAPSDAYTCAMRELAVREYIVQSTDRASGFIKAEKPVGGLMSGSYVDEITVTILPAGAGSDVRVAASRARVSGNGSRSTNGMVAPKSVKEAAAAIGATCSASP